MGFALKILLSLVMKLATEEFFKDILLHLAELGVKSTATTWDDEVLADIKKALDKPALS